ncbi:MAG: helix-turn-helix transcriptional regulator [Hyphomicrobium sp.]|jgi:transcriptional regulator with XRE-family HTH domain
MGRTRKILRPIRSPLVRELVGLIDAQPLTQAQLAERANVLQSTVSAMCTGRMVNPTILVLERLAGAYGYEIVLRPRRRKNITAAIMSMEETP